MAETKNKVRPSKEWCTEEMYTKEKVSGRQDRRCVLTTGETNGGSVWW
jgi:hypothetical protein